MKIHDCVQGSDEWRQLRLGIPTASQFDRLITPKTRKPSSQRRGYMCELIAERILGKPIDSEGSSFMERGSKIEAEARGWYGFEHDKRTVRQVGFITEKILFEFGDGTAYGTIGCSPDGLVDDDGGLEIKCPGIKQHIANLISLDPAYTMQMQGCMWIADRKWWDFVSFCPGFPTAIYRVQRDDELIFEALAEIVATLLTETAEMMAELQNRYHFKEEITWANLQDL